MQERITDERTKVGRRKKKKEEKHNNSFNERFVKCMKTFMRIQHYLI